MSPQVPNDSLDRRKFLQASSGGVAATVATSSLPAVHASSGGEADIRIGVIGCGGRGTGAMLNAVKAEANVVYPDLGYHTETVAKGAKAKEQHVKVVALADLFDDRLQTCLGQAKRLGFEIEPERCFTGFDSYQKLLAVEEVNYVILATPPHFRPAQFKAAIEAGKHVFMEKPVAVDSLGVRTVMEAAKRADDRGLSVAAGTQRRHQPSYRETIRRIQEGMIGDITSARCYWNGGQIWVVPRKDGWSDMEWQCRNWNYFRWLSGDHYVEQHVHNLDIMNWVIGSHPVKAVSAVGGRQVRTAEQFGNIYDHFAVEYEYPGGLRMFSQARQINGCRNIIGEEVVGSKGTSNCKNFISVSGGPSWNYDQRDTTPYQLEHENLIASIRDGKPINDAHAIAMATMTGILGREAAYSGREVSWDDAIASETRLGPSSYAMGPFDPEPVPMPGKYRFA